MRLFKYRKFHKWAIDEGISDTTLIEAFHELEHGLFDANLGGGLYKKRVARSGQGKSKGYRVLIAFRQGNNCFFIYGFAKNEVSNIADKEREVYQRLGNYYLSVDDEGLKPLIALNELIEVII